MEPRVYSTPAPDAAELRVLERIAACRAQLQHQVREPRRWFGSLRRLTFARAVQGSNSIEGYNASLQDVVAAVDGEAPLDADEETTLALAGYRDAMTYVLQHAGDPGGDVDEGLLKALHFMMLKHDLGKNPGRWRPGAIWVRRESTGETVYEGPPVEQVPALVGATIGELAADRSPVLVRAAMAHLNLVMVHPFSDGNGRMARALQTLVLAREQIVAPIFSSIEEYLGRNTSTYYDVLAAVGRGAWHPENDARPWVRFCLTAHLVQAQTHLRRLEEIDQLYIECLALVLSMGLPERTAAGLVDAAFGLRLRNAAYRSAVQSSFGDEISKLTATRDLTAMVEQGLLEPVGERRGRYYLAARPILDLRRRIRATRPPKASGDPFASAAQEPSLSLFSGDA